MSNKQTLAEHGVALCVAGLGYSTAAGPAGSIAVIGSALYDMWRKSPHAKRATARDAGMARLAALGITERQAEVALHYLKDYEIRFEVDPDLLKDARARGSFPQTLYDTLFDPKTIPPDDRIPEALFAIVEGAWDVLRQEEHVHKLFTQESLLKISEDTDELRERSKRLETQANRIFQLAEKQPKQFEAEAKKKQVDEISQLILEIGRQTETLPIDDLISFLQRLRREKVLISDIMACDVWHIKKRDENDV